MKTRITSILLALVLALDAFAQTESVTINKATPTRGDVQNTRAINFTTNKLQSNGYTLNLGGALSTSAAVSITGAFTVGAATTINGGGTLALGGFTFTVPGTGTGVLTTRTLTAGVGLTGGGTLAANRTFSLGTPSTLTVATLNSASGTTHTHAITSSSNPGAAASVLASNSSGGLQLTSLALINGISPAELDLFNASTGFVGASSGVLNLQTGTAFRSSDFVSGVRGFNINHDGRAEFEDITVRGAIKASVFTIGEITATAGTTGVFKSAGKMNEPVTTPATEGTTFHIVADNNETGDASLFAIGDVLRVKTWTGSAISDVYMTVTNSANLGGRTQYAVTLNKGTNAALRAGAAIVDYGPSGTGFVTQSADGTVGASPNLTMATHTGKPWTGGTPAGEGFTIRTRLGNLNGYGPYNADVYGFGAGAYGVPGESWVFVDPTNGVRLGNNLTTRIHLAANGSGFLANGNIAWDTAGNATIAGWSVAADRLVKDTGTNNTSAGLAPNDFPFFAGATYANRATAPFRVTPAGALTASSGTIGGFSLSSDRLTASGGGNASIGISSNPSEYALWAGSASSASAPFRVGFFGDLHASAATITGAITATSGSITGTMNISGSGKLSIGGTTELDVNGLRVEAGSVFAPARSIRSVYSGADVMRLFTNASSSTSTTSLETRKVGGQTFAQTSIKALNSSGVGSNLFVTENGSNAYAVFVGDLGGPAYTGVSIGTGSAPGYMLHVGGEGTFQGAGATIVGTRAFNTSTAASTKEARMDFFGKDTVGTTKWVGGIGAVSTNNDWITGRLAFYSRVGDATPMRMSLADGLTLGGYSDDPGAGAIALVGRGSSPPTIAGHAILFSAYSGSTAVMKVRNSNGTETQISPHADNSPAGDHIDAAASAVDPIVIYQANEFTGTEEWIHLSALAKEVEQSSGKQFVYAGKLPTRRDWSEYQAEAVKQRERESEAWEREKAHAASKLAAWNALPKEAQAQQGKPEPFKQPRPPAYTPVQIPARIQRRIAPSVPVLPSAPLAAKRG